MTAAMVAWLVMQIVWFLVVSTFDQLRMWDRGAAGKVLYLVPPLGFAGLWLWRHARADRVEAELWARAFVTRSGFRLVPDAGDSSKSAIVCLERDPARIPAAEAEFAAEKVFGTSSQEWLMTEQALAMAGGRAMDVLTFKHRDGETKALYFDVSRSRLFGG